MSELNKPVKVSNHWYTRQGESRHTVTGANGKERATNVKDARSMGLLPSVNGILGVLDSFSLTKWKQEQAALAAERTLRNKGESDAEWLERVMDAAFQQVEQAKDLGSAIHAALEHALVGEDYNADMAEYVQPVLRLFEEKRITPKALEVGVVNLPEGYAGRMDLAFTWGKAGIGVLDFKSKKSKPGEKPFKDVKQGMQLAAYAAAYWGVDRLKDCLTANVFISTTEPGRVDLMPWEDLPNLYDTFLHCCAIWRRLNNYDPRVRS